MTQTIEVGNFHECLRRHDRYQVFTATASLSFLVLTWKWPWAGKKLINSPMDVPPVDSINIGFVPIEHSISVAILIIFSAFLISSSLALFCIGRAKKLGNALSRYGEPVINAVMTFPSLATHGTKFVRIGIPLAISIMILIAVLREFWWEGSTFWDALVKGSFLSILVLIPQLRIIEKLWIPLVSSQGVPEKN